MKTTPKSQKENLCYCHNPFSQLSVSSGSNWIYSDFKTDGILIRSTYPTTRKCSNCGIVESLIDDIWYRIV